MSFGEKKKMNSANVFTFLVPPNSDHAMVHLGGLKCSVCSHLLACGKFLDSCNLPSESSRDPNWMAAKM